ncbi:hypothetical protein AUR63_08675 [Guyparkeria sp. XI15]|nr:hypothetical protein AUR63_08675 [Guyparkeria sp. XI15]OAE88511.1 hypothetical protein AWR35_08690 [Guyparkeria sp. WRN-7]
MEPQRHDYLTRHGTLALLRRDEPPMLDGLEGGVIKPFMAAGPFDRPVDRLAVGIDSDTYSNGALFPQPQ